MYWRYLTRAARRCSVHTTSSRTVGWWDHVAPAAKDPINGVTEAFLADPSPYKINLGVGAYRDDKGRPVVLQCVREAEAKIAGSEFLESISASVSTKMVEESVKLVYGKDSDVVKEGRSAGVQALSGTGACRLFAEFQRRFHPESHIYFPDPTWSNHHNIWRDAQIPERTYHYYDPDSKSLDFAALMDDIKNAPDSSFFLLHPSAHNPTGVDPTEEQWREISYQFKVKGHFPFFDMAYQGFASGDLDKDAQAIRIFLEDEHLIGCAQSYAKSMGLYGHRVGCLSILCVDSKQAAAIRSQIQQIARAMYGSPPVHGILLVATILSDPNLKSLWIDEVKIMADRIQRKRTTLRQNLEKLGSSLNWEHITNQLGMFCFSGLTPYQVDRLAKEFHIYMTHDGRISEIACLKAFHLQQP
ncbi:aspartate aminotransferase, mitochondrial-like isoform X2 [Citrus sinensis]|uniref:aspartate aminotransferase, mitochondrial-like isoform X2 n=1 Tax=Citrus sinensis TaxID=2711 RepID=UPI0022776AD6|nr:aspartate aminotransferase, mitochondrial-like isoform X2 [Citrus sinensis]